MFVCVLFFLNQKVLHFPFLLCIYLYHFYALGQMKLSVVIHIVLRVNQWQSDNKKYIDYKLKYSSDSESGVKIIHSVTSMFVGVCHLL